MWSGSSLSWQVSFQCHFFILIFDRKKDRKKIKKNGKCCWQWEEKEVYYKSCRERRWHQKIGARALWKLNSWKRTKPDDSFALSEMKIEIVRARSIQTVFFGQRKRRKQVSEWAKSKHLFNGEFDPGSGRTLAACLTHASRTELYNRKPSGGRI